MDFKELPGLTRPNISDEVYRTLRERFLSNQFKPGQRLHLDEMQRQMEISRTPLKDALNRLALEGLVRIKPRSGTFVAPLDVKEIADAFEVRYVLERYAIELVIAQVTEEQLAQLADLTEQMKIVLDLQDGSQRFISFVDLDHRLHQLIIEFTGNRRLLESWEQVNVHVQMARVRYAGEAEEFEAAQKEHEEFLRTLQSGDVNAARAVLEQHLTRARVNLLAEIKNQVQLSEEA